MVVEEGFTPEHYTLVSLFLGEEREGGYVS